MLHVSRYERQLIESTLGLATPTERSSGALVIAPDAVELQHPLQVAIWPALSAAGFRKCTTQPLFNSYDSIERIVHHLRCAEMIVADVTGTNPDVMYVVGLSHGLGRYPILISQDPDSLLFAMRAFRCIRYDTSREGLWDLRENLARAARIFLTSAGVE
jgi:hypothetical protein